MYEITITGVNSPKCGIFSFKHHKIYKSETDTINKGACGGMEEISETRYCETCQKDTVHVLREDAIEIEMICNECHQKQQIVKTFF